MDRVVSRAKAPGGRPSKPKEEFIETAIRKLYPYLQRWRNPLPLSVNGRSARLHHGGQKDHFYAAYQCFYRNQYEVPSPLFSAAVHTDAVEARYQGLVRRGVQPLIVDCGANIGASVLWFMNRYPAARVIAVEPAAANLVLLRQNVAGLDVAIVAGGVGAADGILRLDGNSKAPLSFRVIEGGAGHEVELFSLASVLEYAGDAEPFILKVDIEGGEQALFSSDPAIIARFPVIILEPHDFCMPGKGVSQPFLSFHAAQGRDFLFANENIFSIDYEALIAKGSSDPG